jgi:uncharacterized protein YfbU (UPF0304 family)
MLAGNDPMARDIEVSDTERLILKNQYAILEFLSRAFPDLATRGNTTFHDPRTYAWYQTVLSGGEQLLVRQLFDEIQTVELSLREQEQVLAILDMYRHLQHSFDRLEDKAGLTEDDVRFDGWDGHRRFLGFAQRFCFRHEEETASGEIAKPDRYDMIRPSPAFDSHSPLEEGYMRMLEVYQPIRKACINVAWRPMTAEEIEAVLAGRVHPDNR